MPDEPASDDETPWVYACLGVYGAFEPDDVGRLLGVEAKTVRKGDRIRWRAKPTFAEHDSWHHSTEKLQQWDWTASLQEVLGLVRPHQAEFARLTATTDVQVHIVAEATERTPYGELTPQTLAELAELGCSLDVDLCCSWGPRQHDGTSATPPG